MRSNSSKEQVNNNHGKGKKVMEIANLISAYQSDKNKVSTDKKVMINNKSCNNYKPSHHDDCSFDIKNNINEKLKPNRKPQHEVKRHNRSKTQNFDLNLYQSSTFDLFQDIRFTSKINSKKSQLKKQESKKRLKTESLKRFNQVPISKNSSKDFKKYYNPLNQKQIEKSFKQKKQKTTKKQKTKASRQKEVFVQTAGYDLQTLKGKFKKQKSDYDQKKERSKTDNKNFSLLNLSHILHRNQYEDFMYQQQKQVRKSQIKSDRSSNKNFKAVQKKRVQAYKNLGQLVEHFTSSVEEQLEENNLGKGNENEINHFDIAGGSFSFANQMINQEIKPGKSNFSTGVGSIGLDQEIQQLIKLKLKTQREISQKISSQIKEIQLSHQFELHNAPKSSRRKILVRQQTGQKSARTFRQKVNEQKQILDEENLMLLDLLSKFNIMAQKVLPLIYQSQSTNPEQSPLQDVPQQSYLSELNNLRKNNQKYLSKFNQIARKNTHYQEIINALIRDGVDVQKYMASYFKSK